MKRKIGFISLDSSTTLWLKDKLRFGGPDTDCGKELLESLEELICGATTSLMLDLDDGEHVSKGDGIFYGELAIHPQSRTVLRNNEEIQLTPKEFDILCFLAKNCGDVFTKEQIYQAVWEEDYLLASSNIMAFIRKLRKKIEPNPDAPEYILTIWGIGYKFNDRLS